MAFPALPTHGKLARMGLATAATASTVGCQSTLIDYTSRWSINWTKDAAVFGRQGMEYKEALPGQGSFTGSGEFLFVNSSEQATMIGLMVTTDATVALSTGPASTRILKFYFDSTDNWVCSSGIVFTGLTFDAPVGDLVRCSFTFQGSGPLVQYSTTHTP